MSNSQISSVETKNYAPGLRGVRFFRRLPEFHRDLLGTYERMREEFGDVICLRGAFTLYAIFAPADIEYVLQTNSRNYWKGFGYQVLKDSTGNGLFTSEGDFWLKQRRLAQPVFHRHRIAGFAQDIAGCAAKMLDNWEKRVDAQQSFDAMPELMRLTLSIVGKTLLSRDLAGEADVFSQSYEVVREYTMRRMMSLVKIPRSIPTLLNLRFRRAIERVDRIVYDIIENRCRAIEQPNDLLGMLMAARDEQTGETMNHRQLRDEVMTIIGAGYETTTQALGWTFYFLGKNPRVEQKLRDEIETVLNNRAPTFDDLPKLQYTLQVFKEAMRLRPPVWAFARQAIEADRINGYYVPPKSQVVFFPYITHRRRDLWEQPAEFLPERFAPDMKEPHKFAYFPFGGGHRVCIGNNFAMMEAQIIIVMTLARFRVRLDETHRVEPEASVTLRPRNGVKIFLEKI